MGKNVLLLGFLTLIQLYTLYNSYRTTRNTRLNGVDIILERKHNLVSHIGRLQYTNVEITHEWVRRQPVKVRAESESCLYWCIFSVHDNHRRKIAIILKGAALLKYFSTPISKTLSTLAAVKPNPYSYFIFDILYHTYTSMYDI